MAMDSLHRRMSKDIRDSFMTSGSSLYVNVVPSTDMNKNTSWFEYPGIWTTYILIIFFSWLILVSAFGCSAGTAWTIVNLIHFGVTYYFFHWTKGTPFEEDQGQYKELTWWEQLDEGCQFTRNRKFLTIVPIVLYLIAIHTTDYSKPSFFFNTGAFMVMLIAKLPSMHRVRIFGINAD